VAEQLVLQDGLRLESGAVLAPLEIAYAAYGDPAHPAVYICHALTGDAEAADWWDTLVGPGRPVDTDRF
jgi:homoserine O-acetyltransferase